jgi:CheY-like chemotaxis protein
MHVLVVDDSPTNRIMMARGIARQGHTVVQANDGMEALQLYVDALASGLPFHLLVTDMTMPRMCGDELATAVHAAHAEHVMGGGSGCGTVVIGVTGNAMKGEVEGFLAAGAHAVLLKPATVARVLEEAAAAAANEVAVIVSAVVTASSSFKQ